ncbi:hypothetical protein HK100_001302 [Physocladia obscura]|uniref:Uncharacterized protein n=1 Tax=Physocladia obscura TaxID=109957 RepID=A0AAD5T2Z6_9FUNG|nr:hypothetical protein HK100_001302 [Physocladia obscura]
MGAFDNIKNWPKKGDAPWLPLEPQQQQQHKQPTSSSASVSASTSTSTSKSAPAQLTQPARQYARRAAFGPGPNKH